ncbi:MAG: ABC transporter permease, partial [Rhizobiales bacterium]|nr:ABC transporter permease [Hyphomicrobiales bacterium]
MSEPRPVKFRGGGFAPTSIKWIGPIVFIVLIGLLELGTQTGIIAPLTLPKPSDVLATFAELWRSGQLWLHLLPSLTRLIIGAALG